MSPSRRLRPEGRRASLLCDVLQVLSAGSLGLLVGALLTEGFLLVPHWRSLPPAEFFAWYAANAQRLLGFFGPLTFVATLLPVAAAITSFKAGHPGRWPALLAAVLSVVVVATYFFYFEQANASFAAATIRADAVPAELARWASWHWLRVGLGLAAFAAALLSLGRRT